MSDHRKIAELLTQAVDTYPVDEVLESLLTVAGKLGANMREANIISDCALMLAFTDAMRLVFDYADAPTAPIRIYRERGTLQ